MEHLKPYTNPEFPNTKVYRFERESVIRMLAKGKTLTMYEPGPQFIPRFMTVSLVRSKSEPTYPPREMNQTAGRDVRESRSSASDTTSAVYVVPPASSATQVDFHMATTDGDRIAGPIPKVPPDGKPGSVVVSLIQDAVARSTEQLVDGIRSIAVFANKRPVAQSLDFVVMRQPLDRCWRDLKGVTAVVIASI